MKTTLVKSICLLVGLVAVMMVAPPSSEFVLGQGTPCGMQLNQMPVIFCDTFDQPSPVTNRSGQLNGEVWGVSRLSGGGTEWGGSTIDTCNGSQPAAPPNDVIICNGRLRQSQWDMGNVTMLAMYPKQPFDFAGRTGTVSFDVTNDTSGMHGAWPEFWLTDQPVPAPMMHGGPPCDFCSLPRNGFGIRFGANEGACPGGWRAESVVVVRNYVPEEHGIFWGSGSGVRIQDSGCARLSSGPNGGLNHIELRISQNQIDIYSSDAGSTTLKLINRITNANLSLTRGLIWIGDGHYNASKSGASHDDTIHTYTWDNVAFDGPATYRDLSFDVLDRMQPLSGNRYDLGWPSTPSNPARLQTLPMTAANISAARSALLMFNYGLFNQISTFNYTINGHAMSVPSPVWSSARGMRSVAMDVPLAYLVPGAQSIVLSGNQDMVVANVNVVLVAAAPVPGTTIPSAPTAPSNLRIVR